MLLNVEEMQLAYELHIDPAAIKWIQKRSEGKALRLGIKSSGCNGYAYIVEFAPAPVPGEELVEIDGVGVLLKAQDAPLMSGMRLELKEDKFESRIVFNNPNTKSACGCGASVGF